MTEESSKFQTLYSFCQNGSFRKTKVALLTFYKVHYSLWIEKLLLIFEYLQLISQALLASMILLENSNQQQYLFKSIVYAFKLVNPSELLSYERSDSMTLTVLVILFCCTLLKILLFGNVIYVALRNRRMISWLLLLWQWIYKLQARGLYFLFTSFWVKTIIEAQENGFSPFGMRKYDVVSISSFMFAVEVILSFILETQLCCFLPTKSFLSSKNNHLVMATFLQKFFIQVMILAIRSDSEALAWIASIIGIIMGVMKLYKFFETLPLYHFEALLWQGGLLVTVLSLNLSYFVNNILRDSDYGAIGINFVIITWILLALLTNKISYRALKIQILSLISENNQRKQTPEILLHKVFATQELKTNEKLPLIQRSGSAFSHLVSTYQNINLQEIFGIQINDLFLSPEKELSQEAMNKLYLMYYEDLRKKHPTNFLLKLHTAHRSFKNSEPYTKTIKIAKEIQENRWSVNYLSCSLLLYDIEKSILASFQENKEKEENLDFFSYIRSRILMDNLRSKMLKQTDLHLKVCNNILSDISNFEEIHSSAQRINKLKKKIEKKITKLSHVLPEHYISPLLSYAEYHLVANHSAPNFEKYYELYTQKYLKVHKFLKESNLIQENLYQDSNAFLLLSTQKVEYGKILYCSKSLVDLCGGQNVKVYEGSNISVLFPSFLGTYYDGLLKQNKLTETMNRVHRGFVFNKEKHVVEADFCIKYHPYLTQGLCLNMIIRPVPVTENTDFLLLSHDGDILGASKEVSRLLNLNKGSSQTLMISVQAISDQLYLMNNAVNFVMQNQGTARKESNSPSSWRQYSPRRKSRFFSQIIEFSEHDKAKEIYTAFTSGDQQIQIYPYNEKCLEEARRQIKPYKFSCCVQMVNFGNLQVKQVSLKLIKANEQQEARSTLIKFIETPTTLITKEEDIEEDYFPPTSLDHIQTTTRYYFHTASHIPTSPETQGDLPLLSPERCQFKEPETAMTLALPFDFQRPTPRSLNPHSKMILSASGFDMPPEEDMIKIKRFATKEHNKYLSSQNSSIKSTESAEDRIYRSAILTKSYPKSFRGLCLIFYFVLILTFAGQILMRLVSSSTMKDLQTRKNLLKESEERVYKGALIEINAAGIVNQMTGIIKAGGVYNGLPTIIANLQIRMDDMMEANTRMLNMLDSLDEETQRKLFVADIKMEGNYLDPNDTSLHYLNAFQVTDEAAMILRMLVNMNISDSESYPTVQQASKYLEVNLVNDFLSKSKQITDILTGDVEEQKKSFQNTTNLFLILSPFLLMSIGVLLTAIIWNQYRIENTNMKAFIKIPSKEVRVIAEKLAQFKKDLLNEETFEKKWVSKTNQSHAGKLPQNERISVYSKSSETHKIQYKEFWRRYYSYISRVILCISALVAITLWDLIITQGAIKVIYNRQDQLQFANYISNTITVTSITYAMLFYTNNSVKVENKYPFVYLPDLAESTKQIQADTPKKFLEVDGTYNPAVRDIIYENNPECKGFTPDFLNYCTTLVDQGQPVNMIVVIAAFQNIISSKLQDYTRANKSSLAEVLEADTWTPTPLPYFISIAEEAHRIANIMDDSMTAKIDEMQEKKKSIIIVFSIGLIVVGVLIWFYILKVIREVHNDFKKVLQIFPANLVLSSFLLKRFLQQSSKNPLFQ